MKNFLHDMSLLSAEHYAAMMIILVAVGTIGFMIAGFTLEATGAGSWAGTWTSSGANRWQ